MSKKPATEILVHIAAPSRSKDDTTYRALANAYLDFEPTTRTSVFSKTISPNVVAKQAVARPQPIGTGSLGPSTQPSQIIRSSGIAGFIETPALSWRDAANNLASPSLRMRQDERHVEPSQNSQFSWQPPPSVIQDSLPDNNVTLSQFCTPTRLLEDYLHPSDSSQSLLSPIVERAPRVQQPTAAQVQTQYEGDSTFPTINHISQRRQVDGLESGIVLPQPNSPSQGNGPEREAEDDVQPLYSQVNTTKELHVSAPPERHSSCGQVNKQRSTTTESLPKSSLRRQTPADPRTKVIPLSPAVNANNKRRRSSPSSRDSEFMIASSQPAAQEQVPPRANTIISDGGGPSNKPSLSSSPPRTESEPPPTKRRRTSPDPVSAPTPAPSSRAAAPSSSANLTPKSPGKLLARSSSDIGPRQDAIKSHQLAERNARLSSVLELHSPSPETLDFEFDLSSAETREGEEATDDTSLITPVLAKLATDLNLAKRFRPSLQTRSLRPYERGYWLVDCTSWDRELKKSCWLFLADYLDSGAAGWGIWCKRDEDFTQLRMYCWGRVVGHMYLVLYIISRREVLTTGTEWVDGDGEVVIKVEARPRPEVGIPSVT